jgi:hypothetical protein
VSATGLGLRVRTSMSGQLAYSPGLVGTISVDYLFGIQPAPVYDIPHSWLRRPLSIRQDPPQNDARITRTGGGEARRTNPTSITAYKTRRAPAVELDTATAMDPASLAAWTVAVYPDPRDRCPQITINLREEGLLTPAQQIMLLQRQLGDRLRITDAPATWPPGMDRMTIEGRTLTDDGSRLLLTFTVSPMLGTGTPGEVGPWWQLDVMPIGEAPIAF